MGKNGNNPRQQPINLEGGQKPKLGTNWGEFLKGLIKNIAIVAVLLTILGAIFTYILRTEDKFATLQDRVGKLEGQIQIILQDRPDLLKLYYQKMASTSATQ